MTITHHLSESLMMAYAAGTLPEAFSLVAATHISMCDECRAWLGAHEAVGGAILEAGAAPMAEGSLDAVMARLSDPFWPPEAARRAAPPGGRAAPEPPEPPEPLRSYIGADLSAVRWRRLGMGVRQAILPTGPGASARLLHIEAGRAVPDHGHRGMELTLVLQGSFHDGTERFGPGDLEIATQDLHHMPVAEPGADCICLAATDAPLRFTSVLPRLMQPFFRI